MFHGYGVNMSEGQALKLRRGHAVRLKHDDLEGSHKLMLTADQIKKLEKAKRAGKGSTLQLHPDQISHMLMMGGSIFSSLKSAARKFARLAKPVASAAYDTLRPVAENLIEHGKDRLKRKALQEGEKLLESGLRRIGAGRPRKHRASPSSPKKVVHHRKHPIRGGFSLGDFVSGIQRGYESGKNIYEKAKPIYDIAAPVLDPLVEKARKKVGLGMKKHHMVSHARNATSLRGNAPIVQGGFGFGDFLGGVKDIASAAAPIAVPVLTGALGRRLGGGAKKKVVRKGKKGGSLFSDIAGIFGGKAGRPRKMPSGMGLYAPGMAR